MDGVEPEKPRTVYTVGEVAAALRVSSETIRRKIAQGELRAVEVTRTPRKQYRILLRDLTDWLGEEQARAVFGVGDALVALRSVFTHLPNAEQAALLEEAKDWARAHTPERGVTGRRVSTEALAERFGLRAKRIIPDANVLLGGIVGNEERLARRPYLSFRRGDCAFVVSAELLSEIERILSYPKVIALGVTPALAFSTAVDLLHLGEYWPNVARYDPPSVGDPKDWYLFNLLFASGADALITQDRGMLRAGAALQLPVLHPGELSRLGLP